MKVASIKELKDELKHRSKEELLNYCLQLSKFKKENKELLTYILFESIDQEEFIAQIKKEVENQFDLINRKNFYLIKKSVRKILKTIKKYIRYSKKKETEVELLLFFCAQLSDFSPSIKRNTTLLNLYNRQVVLVKKGITMLHEDLQYDYELELENLM
ncbi:hypothetical protein JM83_2799 [Gillisia sp. Hel_I_86]|uniref:hypothetical protein n=1 Tax=Gillisia sp. Hel_I_86 TaxID=1249981 RepID=UPI00119972B3|nr:hypothetical protein [Gillisia sp. Hel_I_86]TVZ27739.1 hypothetical protein JM83_2799 [Gillisia sp. Hel_I_86]